MTNAPEANQQATKDSNISTKSDTQSLETKKWTLPDRIWDGLFPSSLQRLRDSLPGFHENLQSLRKRNESKPRQTHEVRWAESAESLFKQAQQAAEDRDVELGWRCYNAADTFTLYGLDRVDKPALKVRATAIATEAAEKVSSKWRKDAINALLQYKDGNLPDNFDVNGVVAAKIILDEYHDNVYRRLGIIKSRLLMLTAVGFIFLLVWLFVLVPPIPATLTVNDDSSGPDSVPASMALMVTVQNGNGRPASVSFSAPMTLTVENGSNRSTDDEPSFPVTLTVSGKRSGTPTVSPRVPITLTLSDEYIDSAAIIDSLPMTVTVNGTSDQNVSAADRAAAFWRLVVLAGILGGLISAFTSAIGADWRKSNIPAELSTQTITYARLVLSALSALAATLLLTSGILSFGQLSYPLVFAVAVVSGFTDRLLKNVIERAANTT